MTRKQPEIIDETSPPKKPQMNPRKLRISKVEPMSVLPKVIAKRLFSSLKSIGDDLPSEEQKYDDSKSQASSYYNFENNI